MKKYGAFNRKTGEKIGGIFAENVEIAYYGFNFNEEYVVTFIGKELLLRLKRKYYAIHNNI